MTTNDPAELLRSLRRVRQVRSFTDQPVTDAELDAIVDVGRWSGSSRNGQPWRFILLRDIDVVRRIAAMDMPHSRALTTAMAAIAIVVPATADPVSHAYDEGRAAERMLIATSQLGLAGGLLWISGTARDAINELLGVPAGRTTRSVLAIGHPAPEASAPKNPVGQARRPRERMVARDRWTIGLDGD
jgi:nitroreductase